LYFKIFVEFWLKYFILFVKQYFKAVITRKNFLFFWFNSLNKVTFFSTIALIIIGLIVSFSLSYAASEKVGLKEITFFQKHLFFCIITLFAIIFFSIQSLENLKIICFVGFFISIAVLIMTLFGTEIKGSKRWIYLFGFSLQPSEFLKPFFIYVFSFLFTSLENAKAKSENKKNIIFFILFLHTIIIFLFFLQPDFGMIVIFNILLMLLFYINAKSLKYFFGLCSIGLIIASIIGFSLDHVKYRISTFLFGLENYQSKLAATAIQNGGFFGKGFGESKLKFILPEAHNDFIFSILIEEFGFVFCLILGLIFLLFTFANFNYLFDFKKKIINLFSKIYYTKNKIEEKDIITFISKFNKKNANNKYFNIYYEFLFCRNFLTLSCVLIFFEFFINASVSLNLVPTKGMAMPFVSYGGSSLIAHGILVGIMLNLNKKRYLFLM
jgi:cell division protein FtsW